MVPYSVAGPRLALAVLAAASLAAGAAAQTFTVAPSGGNFTDIPAAVAAVPSGATLLVMPGNYSPFALQNKSLTILGVGSPRIVMNGSIAIGPLASTDTVVVSGLAAATGGAVGGDIVLQGCAGAVVLDGLELQGYGSFVHVRVQSCANVHLLRCATLFTSALVTSLQPALSILASTVEIAGGDWAPPSPDFLTLAPGNVGCEIDQQSLCTIVGARVTGGVGRSTANVGTAGGAGVRVRGGSRLFVSGGATLRGGNGGIDFVNVGGNGGDGLVVEQGSVAVAYGAHLQGGLPGGLLSVAGAPTRVDPTSSLTQDAGQATPVGVFSGTFSPGNTIHFGLATGSGQLGWLLLGSVPLAGAAPWLDCGLLGVQAWGTVGPVIASPLGAGDVPVLVPPGWPANVVLFAQWLTIDPGTNRVFGSNTFTAIS